MSLRQSFRRLIDWFDLRIARHEVLVLRWARAVPLLSMFTVGTLAIWIMVPAILISPVQWHIVETQSKLGLLAFAAVVLPPFFATVPWFWSWYLVGWGLMAGNTRRADLKAEVLRQRLARLGQPDVDP
ncbi:MAG: hypothetical protein AAF441_22940 [Pseudomonadota bacterium]